MVSKFTKNYHLIFNEFLILGTLLTFMFINTVKL